MAVNGFGKASGPSSTGPNFQNPFANISRPTFPFNPSPSSRPIAAPQRPSSQPLGSESSNFVAGVSSPSANNQRANFRPPAWGNGQKGPGGFNGGNTYHRPPAAAPPRVSQNPVTGIPANISQIPQSKRSRSPTSVDPNSNKFGDSSPTVIGRRSGLLDDHSRMVVQRTSSPALTFQNNQHAVNLRPSFGETRRQPPTSTASIDRPRSQVNYADLSSLDEFPALPSSAVSYSSQAKFATAKAGAFPAKQIKSSSSNEADRASYHNTRNVPKRNSNSPPRVVSGTNERSHSLTSMNEVNFPSTSNSDLPVTGIKSNSVSLPKRTRSPPLPDHVSLGNSYLVQDETEREILAKAKRLARFKDELTQTMADDSDNVNQKFSGNKDLSSTMGVQKNIGENSTEAAENFPSIGVSDEGTEPSRVITGLCPDMCPESERAERERKGDLDQFERVDGDRNQTSKYLAVKKYTRTAEREAMLIRPMPILQRTIDYLLSLLDQPYDVTFLGMYNFLWDRMRAVRMDLRMQHIFDLGAITMLEQMIRLHVVAMHELCEYTKGEGFSEGFDAHLNIEQMNKTSVELFQLYDDHRKRGVDVPSEKEFRGYYALLKLDKHPGYKVEPAELSLDLAKMTPEMRQNSEVLFARDVARACRTGNYIAFFRLARKASYLQACLMHAHFAKLRNQALASLHSGLQNNQGIPVAQVARWLGMEEEDIESLMDYHGFSVKEFEEPYMVKDAPFINSDKDYPTRCSELVHLKKSKNIIEDILSSSKPVLSPVDTRKKPQLKRSWNQEPPAVHIIQTDSPSHVLDEDMPDFKAISSPKNTVDVPVIKKSPAGQKSGDGLPVASMRNVLVDPFSTWNSTAVQFPAPEPLKVIRTEKPDFGSPSNHSPGQDAPVDIPPMPLQILRKEFLQESPRKQFNAVVMEKSIPQDRSAGVFRSAMPQHFEEVETDDDTEIHIAKEVAEAKLKLMFRLWKRRCWRLKGLREQKLQAATAALSSLLLGPPIRQNITVPITSGVINIDDIMRERYGRRERSWSKLNISEVIADQLRKQNPGAGCLCFKLVICSQLTSPETDSLGKKNKVPDLAEASWLLSKLIPEGKDEDKGLAVSSPGVAIWKKWISGDGVTDMSCCLSIIKDMAFDQQNETVLGASAALFLFSLKLPWELQKIRLHNLVKSLPSSSSLPLLILSGSHKDEMSDFPAAIFRELGLCNIDKSKISKISIHFLVGEHEMETLDGFYSDEQLKEGLRWVASEIPEQPLLCHVKTRDLVLSRLNSSMEALEKMSGSKVGPRECISAFNGALDHLKCKIGEAAKANPSGWPCPEISLLEESSDEYWACKRFLPSIGWSSIATIDPLISVLDDIKLPPFSDEVSGLTSGFDTVQDIENQRIQVENCIFRYLTESTRLMGIPQATKEACIILQRNAGVELHNSSFYIIPNWVGIFRRIFNWQLQSLSCGDFRDAYILEQEKGVPLAGACISSPYYLNHPSLDEMVEVGCIPLIPRATFPLHGVHQNQSPSYSNSNGFLENAITNRHSLDDGNSTIDRDQGGMGDYVLRSSELEVATMVKTETDRLGELLENCNSLQDRIDRKLSVYF